MEQIYDSIKGEESWEAELVLLNAGKSDLQKDASSAAVKSLEQLRKVHHDKTFPKTEGWWDTFAHWDNSNALRKAFIEIGLDSVAYTYIGDRIDPSDNKLDWSSIMKQVLRIKRIVFTKEREYNYDYDVRYLGSKPSR